jgi:hypothetical protein
VQVKSAAAHETLASSSVEKEGVRGAAAILLGALASLLCSYLPKQFQAPCHAAAKICQLITGGPMKDLFLQLLWPSLPVKFSLDTRQIIGAHAAFESGWGSSKAYVKGNNPVQHHAEPGSVGRDCSGQ